MARRYYSSTAVATTLAAPASNSATSIEATALSGYPVSTPWTAILDPDTASEEVVEVTGVSGTTLTVTRGVDGTTAVSHSAGAVFRHGVSGRDFDEANDHVNTTGNPHSTTASDVGAVANSLIDDAGDLIVGSADNTVGRLALGSDGQVLTVDTAGTGVAKVKWADASGGGPIVSHYFTDGQGSVTVTVPVGKYLVTTDADDTVVTVGSDSVTGKGPVVLAVSSTGSSFGVSRPQIPGAPIEPATWTTRTSQFGSTLRIMAVEFGDGIFFAGGWDGTLTTSTDAITWTTRTSGFGGSIIRGLAYGDNLYVAVGDSGTLSTSTNGTTWTTRTSGFSSNRISAASYGNAVYVIGGFSGRISTSTDGVTWTSRTSPFGGGDNVYVLTFGDGIHVAGSPSGVLATSTNGTTWTTRTSGFESTGRIYAIAHGDGKFIAGGFNGQMASSTDGVSWVSRTSGFGSSAIYGLTFGNGVYVAGGSSGVITTSTDAITWTSRTSGFGTTRIYGLTFGSSRYVAGGIAGVLTTAEASSTSPTDQPTGVVVHALTDVT